MDEGEISRQLLEQLKHENELLKAKVIELEARLAQYENAHTPPSLRRGRNRKKDRDTNSETAATHPAASRRGIRGVAA